jgi:hypothetical protein
VDYTEYIMRGLANNIYNCSQNLDQPRIVERNLNDLLDSLKRMVEGYEEATGKNLDVRDWRDKTLR